MKNFHNTTAYSNSRTINDYQSYFKKKGLEHLWKIVMWLLSKYVDSGVLDNIHTFDRQAICDELVQEAVIALWKIKCDPGRSEKECMAYAYRTAERAMYDYFNGNSGPLYLPSNAIRVRNHIAEARRRVLEEKGHDASSWEIAELTGLSIENVRRYDFINQSAVRLDYDLYPAGGCDGDNDGNVDCETHDIHLKDNDLGSKMDDDLYEEVGAFDIPESSSDMELFDETAYLTGRMLSSLKENERELVELYHFKEKTLTEIAAMKGISHQAVNTHLKRIYETLGVRFRVLYDNLMAA